MDTKSESDTVVSYYTCDFKEYGKHSYPFHPICIVYDKILEIVKEYETKNHIKLIDKERCNIIGAASNNFESLEKEIYLEDNKIWHKESKLRRLVFQVIAKLERTKESKSSVSAFNIGADYNENDDKELKSNGSNRILEPLNENKNSISSTFDWYSTHPKGSPCDSNNSLKYQQRLVLENRHGNYAKAHKIDLFNIKEDEGWNEYDSEEDYRRQDKYSSNEKYTIWNRKRNFKNSSKM